MPSWKRSNSFRALNIQLVRSGNEFQLSACLQFTGDFQSALTYTDTVAASGGSYECQQRVVELLGGEGSRRWGRLWRFERNRIYKVDTFHGKGHFPLSLNPFRTHGMATPK